MADAEGVVGELKRQHGMDRARSRGTPLFHVQLLLGCSALNLKRIVAHADEAATGAAAGPRTVKAEAVEASGEASTRSAGVSWHRITLTAGAGAANTHIIAPAWTIGLSLN
jgi:Transposase DDE domain